MAKKINITAAEFQEKHARNLKASIPDIQRGIDKVTESPTAKAAAKKDKMLANVTAAVQSGKWQAGLRRVSLDDWKQKFQEKGVARISQGIDAAAPKVTAFAEQLLAYEAAAQSEVHNMPDLTLEDSIARQVAWTRKMAKFTRK